MKTTDSKSNLNPKEQIYQKNNSKDISQKEFQGNNNEKYRKRNDNKNPVENYYYKHSRSNSPKNDYYDKYLSNNNNKYRKEDSFRYNNNNINDNYGRLTSCYILLPKNYYNYIIKNFTELSRNIKKKIYDVRELIYNYKLPYYDEYIFKITTVKNYAKSLVIKMISECLFREMGMLYKNMTYLKLTILIPDNVIGFIIGIDGRNINSIREESRAKIEVFPQLNKGKYRKIDISGNPDKIFRACEKIYNIEEKYINFNKTTQKNLTNNNKLYNNNNNNKNKEQSFNISGIESSDKYNNKNYLNKKISSPRKEKFYSKKYEKYNERSRSDSKNKNREKNYNNNRKEEGRISDNESLEEGMIKRDKSENINSDNENNKKLKNDNEKQNNNSIDFIFEKNILEKIKNSKPDFWNEFTKDYECKYIEKPCNLESTQKDSLVLLSLIGTPEQISKGICYLQYQLITQFKDNNNN